ncbi:Rpn family recombination-promoting nuclease/putative transposase, partial [Rickettsia endosymbiont of Cardiosporidium cionae]|uniref:Rpn family recombination-promoting nuclease/putative transposase n=1 Tax=Rickettsia endosymbiont of Cardiosporidium cionae TaxID=2777155 RepID=UPI0018958127
MSKDTPTTANAKHDAFFKQMMSDPCQRERFFSRHLPKRILEKIDIKKLKMEPSSFVDESYAKYHSDLLFSTADKKRYVYFLVEHQSSNDHKIAWRLRQYKDQIWARFQTEYPKSDLPVIYSAVVYNGKDTYTASRIFWNLFAEPAEAKIVENEEYLLVDLQKMEDAILKKEKQLFEYFLKHLDEKRNLFHIFSSAVKEIYALMDLEEQKAQFLSFKGLVWYTVGRIAKNKKEDFLQIIKDILKEKGQSEELMKTIADSWIEEGKVVGKAEGMQLGEARGEARGEAKGIEFTARNMLKKHIDM